MAKTSGTAVALLFKGGNLPVDEAPVQSKPADFRPHPRMESVKRAEAPPAKHDPPFVMQIISGASKHEVTFSGPNAEVKNNGEAKNNNGETK